MTEENQDDGFVVLQEDEITQLEHEVLNNIRFGNNCIGKQFERDIEYTSLAIIDYGHFEQDKIKADVLLKSMLLLFFGQVRYRQRSDQRFYPFDTLDDYFKNNTTLTHFPIAAILLHGSRVLVEFPNEIAHPIRDWLIIDKNSWRYLATHRITTLTEVEVIANNSNDSTSLPIYKCLKEEKVSGTQAAINFVSDSIAGLMTICPEFSMPAHTHAKLDMAEHYGIDLALGGVGNHHFASKKMIQNNGEHGHLYINFYRGVAYKNHSGLLLGIEQSAPGKSDQYGGEHDLLINDKLYSASGGDFFCKKPNLLEIYQNDYRGLSVLPFAHYYDSLWNFIAEDTFALIKTNFEKCKGLLSLLSKEKAFAFIKHILSSPGGAKQQDFVQLFAHYFQEIHPIKMPMTLQASVFKVLQVRHEQLLALCHKKQQAEAKAMIQLLSLRKQVKSLEHEQEAIKQESKNKLIHLRQQLLGSQKEKIVLLFNLMKCFMQTVIQQIGWRANYSHKQMMMLSLQQLDAVEIELNEEYIRNLLKKFIVVSLMNRYELNDRPTHSVSACAYCLNLPFYRPLIRLFFKTPKIDYKDLLTLVAGDKVEEQQIDTSAGHQKNLYRFYQKEDIKKNQLDETKLIFSNTTSYSHPS